MRETTEISKRSKVAKVGITGDAQTQSRIAQAHADSWQ
jgi:hypothetical protein